MESQTIIPGQFGKKFFNVEMTTMNFILLNMATLNVFFFFWICNMCDSINKYYNEIKFTKVLVICMIAFFMWGDVLLDPDDIRRDQALFFLTFSIFVAGPILAIVISFKSRPYIEKMLAEHGVPSQLNGFLCFIFAGFYQYYCIRNAEVRYRGQSAPIAQQSSPADSKFDQIEKLASLKNSGAISEEEFLVEKQKILSE